MFALLCSACRRSPAPLPPGPLEADVSGCVAITEDTCELAPDRRIRIWTRDATLVLRTEPGGQTLATSSRNAVESGVRFGFELPADVRAFTLEDGAHRRKTISVRPALTSPALERAKALRQAGKGADALEELKPLLDGGSAPLRAQAKALAARIDLGRGEVERALIALPAAMSELQAAGRMTEAIDVGFAWAFALHQRSRQYTEARAVLDRVHEILGAYPDGLAREPYYRGLLSAETGDRRSALAHLREAKVRARRLGLTRLARDAQSAYAAELQAVGRIEEARTLLRELEEEMAGDASTLPCDRANVLINLGFVEWLSHLGQETSEHLGSARGALARALALCDAACTDPYVQVIALENAALVALSSHAPAEAEAYMARARAAVREPRGSDVPLWSELTGRVAQARGQHRAAIAAFDEAIALARFGAFREVEWSAEVARATSLEAIGKHVEAARGYERAERLVDEQSRFVPLGDGRGTFLAQREESARRGIELLVRLGRAKDAFRMARASRSRVLVGIERASRIEAWTPDERAQWEQAIARYQQARALLDKALANDWRLSQEKLKEQLLARQHDAESLRRSFEEAMASLAQRMPSVDALPNPPDLTVLVHPGTSQWFALVSEGDRVDAMPVGALGTAALPLASRVLASLGSRASKARAIHLLPFGELRAVDFHALTWEGRPLAAAVLVDYPIDLPPAPNHPADRSALVVSDPARDLPKSREEAALVRAKLTTWGTVHDLQGAQVTTETLRHLLPSVALFHYAGHGEFRGGEGLDTALPLFGGARFTASDVFALPRVPRLVILSGCETARASMLGAAEGLGLAQMFVARGSEAVVAPTRPVSDALAAQFAAALYEQIDRPWAEAFHRAQRHLISVAPQDDWAAFRLVTR